MQHTTPLTDLAAALSRRFADYRRRARERRKPAAMRATDWGDIGAKRPTADDGVARPAGETRAAPRHPLRVALGVPRVSL